MTSVEIIFPDDFDERGAWEAEQRGLLDYVQVRIDGQRTYQISFFTPERIAVEFSLSQKHYLGYPGLILISAINRPTMQKAVEALVDENYFDCLMPLNASL